MLKIFTRSPVLMGVTIVSLVVAVITLLILLATQTLADNRVATVNRSKNIQQQTHDQEIETYKSELAQIYQIRDRYRSTTKKLFELVYGQQAPLLEGTGGVSGNDVVGTTDEEFLLEMRTVIATMDDDSDLLDEIYRFLETRKEFIDSFPFVWPTDGGVPKITSGYGFRVNVFNPWSNEIVFHPGIDLRGDIGDPVKATAAGRILYVFFDHETMGKFIVIQHQSGFTTGYGHLNDIYVKEGQLVSRGEVIGEIGETGKSRGPHLHYEIRKDGANIDPLKFLTVNY